ncbi:uncharacterized protein Bfra_006903 [Botrytis fragariae]|uniref:Uncharacterized protein n=1 Tax=Botrytis fragariae TaxID=1964551 RepID=A0A8H6B5C7_9HELO|nr:uncharacterized protein Bfra_006903 [Botrytis fragariae]KAF5879696.1 hypothetical protein Bfra_006903 [Botrytis fragariae]
MSHYSKSARDSQYDNPQQQRQRQGAVDENQIEAIRKEDEKREREKYEQQKKQERQYAEARAEGRAGDGKDRPRSEEASGRRYGKDYSGEMGGKKSVHYPCIWLLSLISTPLPPPNSNTFTHNPEHDSRRAYPPQTQKRIQRPYSPLPRPPIGPIPISRAPSPIPPRSPPRAQTYPSVNLYAYDNSTPRRSEGGKSQRNPEQENQERSARRKVQDEETKRDEERKKKADKLWRKEEAKNERECSSENFFFDYQRRMERDRHRPVDGPEVRPSGVVDRGFHMDGEQEDLGKRVSWKGHTFRGELRDFAPQALETTKNSYHSPSYKQHTTQYVTPAPQSDAISQWSDTNSITNLLIHEDTERDRRHCDKWKQWAREQDEEDRLASAVENARREEHRYRLQVLDRQTREYGKLKMETDRDWRVYLQKLEADEQWEADRQRKEADRREGLRINPLRYNHPRKEHTTRYALGTSGRRLSYTPLSDEALVGIAKESEKRSKRR